MVVFGEFEEQYSGYGPRSRRKRALTRPERRRQPMPYSLLVRRGVPALVRDSWRRHLAGSGRCVRCGVMAVELRGDRA